MINGIDLPSPLMKSWEWQSRAACRGADTSLFFHPFNERGTDRRRRERNAKAICGGCPVKVECLQWALSVHEPYGTWGGLTVGEREEIFALRSVAS
ncbi:MAG: WhiB family regulatory protein [Pseudonocardiales bacterium]|nr:WhiB family regulatory protein [Pseudonocardiales bacterium]